nr:MAG TPA: hypothetical protein [Caudoviricetes sp.]
MHLSNACCFPERQLVTLERGIPAAWRLTYNRTME